jgi:uncharacterized membrane protein YhaH (DUF805 family)
MSMLIPLGGFALGLAVGRWWIVAVVMPFWAGIVWMDQLDGRLTVVVASQLAVLLACAVGSGVAVRRLHQRRRRRIEA